MKKISRTTRQNAVLLTSASSLVLLAGCDFMNMKNPFSTDRPPQVVEGERRQPIYNQQMINRMQAKDTGGQLTYDASAGIPPAPIDQAAMANAQAIQAAQMQNAQMKAVVPPAPVVPAPVHAEMPMQPAPVAPPAEAFAAAREMPPAPPPPAPPPQAATPHPTPSEGPSAFSRFFSDNSASADGNLPPWKMRQGVQDDYVPPPSEATARAAKMQAAAPAPAQDETAPAWANQWIGKNAPNANSPMDAERTAPYPALSSVPPRPDEFETAKTASPQNMQDLQAARANADANRAALSSEPSQSFKSTPVDMPPEAKTEETKIETTTTKTTKTESYVTPAETNPAETSPAETSSSTTTTSTTSSYPGSSPRRGVDIMTQEQWQALKHPEGSAPAAPANAPTSMDAPQALPQPKNGEPLPTPTSDQHGALEQPDAVIARLPVSGVITQEVAKDIHDQDMRDQDNSEQAVSSSEPPSFLARVFGSLNAEHADTNTPSATASDQPAALTPPEPAPALAAARLQEAQQPKQEASDTAPKQLWLLPPHLDHPAENPIPKNVASAEVHKEQAKAAEEPGSGDWLLALISQGKDSERRAVEATIQEAHEAKAAADARAAEYQGSTPETQLLAQMSQPPVVPEKKTVAHVEPAKAEPAKEVRFAFTPEPAAPELAAPAPETVAEPVAAPAPVAEMPQPAAQIAQAAPAEMPVMHAQPAQLEASQSVPEIKPETLAEIQPETQAQAQLEAKAETQAEAPRPAWMNKLFTQTPSSAPEKEQLGTELTTTASVIQAARAPKVEPKPEIVQQVAEVAPAPAAPAVNRAIAEHKAMVDALKSTKMAKKSKGKTAHETTLAKKDKASHSKLAKKETHTPVIAEEAPAQAAPEKLAEFHAPVAPKAAPEPVKADANMDAPLQSPAELATLPAPDANNAGAVADMPVIQAQAPEPQKTEAAAAPEATELPTGTILQTDAEVNKPEWYNRMFDANGKEQASANTAASTPAVNDGALNQNTPNPARNSASAADGTPARDVNSAQEESHLPTLSSVAAPITQVLAGQAAEAGLAAGAASSLPSPKILQEMKMLPTSRYTARARGTLQDTH